MRRIVLVVMTLALVACGKDYSYSKLSHSELTLISGEEKQLNYKGDCSWSSDEPLIASVEDGLVTAHLVGETYIHANNAVCKVKVVPVFKHYAEPFLKWYEPYSSFEAYAINNNLVKINSDNTGALWADEDTNTLYMCLLKNGKITSSAILTSLTKIELCTQFLCERFIPLGYIDGFVVFADIALTSGITMTLNFDYKDEYALMVICTPYDDTRSDYNELYEAFNMLSKYE